MKKLRLFPLLFLIFILFSSCSNIEERIIETYPNGTAIKIEYYKEIEGVKHLVKETRFYPNGEKEMEIEYLGGKKNGKQTQWFPNGEKWIEEQYKDDIKDGSFSVWYNNGKINYTGEYKNGEPSGKWIFYDEAGSMLREKEY